MCSMNSILEEKSDFVGLLYVGCVQYLPFDGVNYMGI